MEFVQLFEFQLLIEQVSESHNETLITNQLISNGILQIMKYTFEYIKTIDPFFIAI